jgi:dolichyl-phosphate-mannose-protein mannosyltransferase
LRDRARWATSGQAVGALVAAVTVLGLLVRLPSFGDSLFGDELSTYFIVTGHSLGHVVYLLEGGHSIDLNPPLYFMLAWLAERLGESNELLRLPSLIAGTAAIPLTYLLGVRTLDRGAALVGSAVVALSPFLIFFSTEARPFALLLLFTLLSTLALLQAIDTGRAGWWAAYAACSCAATYTSYMAIFVLVAQFGWALWRKPRARPALLLANAAAAVAYLPWLPPLIDDSGSPGVKVPELTTPFGFDSLRTALGRWSIGHPFATLSTVPGDLALGLIAAALAIAVVGLGMRIAGARRVGRPLRPASGLTLVLLLALATPVGAALYSWLGPHSVWDNRQLIASTPELALLAGALVTAAGARVRVLASALLIAGFTIGATKVLEASTHRPDYAGAAGFITGAARPGDPVLDFPLATPGPLTGLEAELADEGLPPSADHPVLRVGMPTRRAMLRARPYADLPTPSTDSIVRRGERLARGRSLFVVAPFAGRYGVAFVDATIKPGRDGLRRVAARTFTGFLPISVYEYRDRGRRGGSSP